MEEINKQALVNQLLAMRATIDAALFILGEADEVENSQQHKSKLDDKQTIQAKCNHPKDHRTVYTTMGSPEHWVCEICDYEHKEDEQQKEG